jgi:hypothetical protein
MTEVIIKKLAENTNTEKNGRRRGIILSQEDINSAVFSKFKFNVFRQNFR